jgi:hypothetical protein
MKKIITNICFVLPALAFGQTIDVTKSDTKLGHTAFYTVEGQPFLNVKYVKLVEGTPYFKDEWYKGSAIGENGGEYKNLTLKLDLLDKQIHYMENSKEYITTSKVDQITLTDPLGNSYKFVGFDIPSKNGKTTGREWYQWLTTGKASLYKEYKKTLMETKAYSSPTTEQKIITKEIYLIYTNNAFLELKKIKDIPSVLADKKTELENFIKNNDDKNALPDDRFKAIIDYYNSLFKETK